MIKFNLLPPGEKKELEIMHLNQILVFLLIRIFFIMIIFIILLTSAYFSLFILLNMQEKLVQAEKDDSSFQKIVEIEEEINGTNKLLKKISGKQKELKPIAPLMKEISEIVPERIYLTYFSYQKEDSLITINGRSETREDLLVMENDLNESEYFEDVDLPLSNLIRQTDLDFKITFKPVYD